MNKNTQKKVEKAKDSARREAAKSVLYDNRRIRRKLATKEEETKKQKTKKLLRAPHSNRVTPPKGKIKAPVSRTRFYDERACPRNWLHIDATDQKVGRLASEIATLLKGKHKVHYTPNLDVGDFIVVTNADKVVFTSNKEDQKKYYRHTGYMGGLKETTVKEMREKKPEQILFLAVKGMLGRGPLAYRQIKKLNVYAGEEHPHKAQLPVTWKLRQSNTHH